MIKISRNKNILLKVTEDELEEIRKNAKKMGLNVSSYLRMLGLKG